MLYSFKCGKRGHFAKDCDDDNTESEWGNSQKCYNARRLLYIFN